MNYVDNHFTLDLCNEQSNEYIPVRKGETMRRLCISLKCGTAPYEITTDLTAQIYLKNTFGTTAQTATISDNTVKYILSSQDTSNTGEIQCYVKLSYGNRDIVISPTFKIEVFDVPSTT